MTQLQRRSITTIFDRDGAFGDFNSIRFAGIRRHMRQRRATMYRSIEG
jgi:hypothetical protein